MGHAKDYLAAFLRLAALAGIALCILGVVLRVYRLERRVCELEAKPCLMAGAHTRCER